MAHLDYQKRFGREADFWVRYSVIPESVAILGKVRQGVRTDFAYADSPPGLVYMIWPEFFQSDGTSIEEWSLVPDEGIAGMWIVDGETIPFHRSSLNLTKQGYLTVGSLRIAKVEIM